MSLYVGIDLHSRNGLVGILDHERRRVMKARVLNDPEKYLRLLVPYRSEVVGVVVESTFNWYWLVDLLMEEGYPLHLANPSAIKQYEGLKHSDDTHDAFWLAEMLLLGILPEGYIYPKEDRPMRDLLRKRGQLVRHRTCLMLSLQNTIERNGGGHVAGAKLKALRTDHVSPALGQNEDLLLSGRITKDCIDYLTRKITDIEKEILGRVELKPAYEHLLTLPAVGKILGLTIMMETGPIGRFATVGDYVSYCRKVPTAHFSDGKYKGHGNKKNGNKYLAWAFSEAAELARRYDPLCRAFFDRKSRKKNRMVAHQALAHKLARAAYFVMRDDVAYQQDKLFGPRIGWGGEPAQGLAAQPRDTIGNRPSL